MTPWSRRARRRCRQRRGGRSASTAGQQFEIDSDTPFRSPTAQPPPGPPRHRAGHRRPAGDRHRAVRHSATQRGRHRATPQTESVRRALARATRRAGGRLRRLWPGSPGEKAEFRRFTFIGWGGIVPGLIGTAAALATNSPMLGLVVTNGLYLVNAPANGLFSMLLSRRLDQGALGTTSEMSRDARIDDQARQIAGLKEELAEVRSALNGQAAAPAPRTSRPTDRREEHQRTQPPDRDHG